MKFPFKNIALIGKRKTPAIAEPLLHLAEFLTSKGISVVVDSLTSEYLDNHSFTVLSIAEIGETVDLAVVMGGDGTMLNIARNLTPSQIPLVGVNLGRLGFLTDLTLSNMQESIARMLDGKFVTDQRLLISAKVIRDGAEIFSGLAFNEVAVHRDNVSSMIEFEVCIDGEYVYTQRADGLIVSTPTGSTAYAMASGGPILHPGLDVLGLVPVCPHTLSNRPLVVKSSSEIEILMNRVGVMSVRFDGHTSHELQLHDKIIVTRHPESVCLLHPLGHSYYHTLREKLLWNPSP